MKIICMICTIVFLASFCFVFFAVVSSDSASAVGSKAQVQKPPWMVPRTDTDTDTILLCDELQVLDRADIPESEKKKERMIAEVVMLWEMFLDDDNASPSDPRRVNFEEYAEYLVDAVRLFQDNPTSIGGQLPKSENIHYLIAQMITKESSVTPGVVGTRGEVCLMQLHGKALAGFTPDQVRRNPRLCLILGVRWLAAQIPTCYPDGAPEYFMHEDWLGPLSVYAGGQNAIRKDGSCKRFGVAHDRVNKMMIYENRIKHEMSLRGWE
jgi:hypothetical protein